MFRDYERGRTEFKILEDAYLCLIENLFFSDSSARLSHSSPLLDGQFGRCATMGESFFKSENRIDYGCVRTATESDIAASRIPAGQDRNRDGHSLLLTSIRKSAFLIFLIPSDCFSLSRCTERSLVASNAIIQVWGTLSRAN